MSDDARTDFFSDGDYSITAAPADARTEFFHDGNVPAPQKTGWQHLEDVTRTVLHHPLSAGIGMAENAFAGITGGVGQLADAVTGSDPGTHDWGYKPQTEAGRELAAEQGDEGKRIGAGYDKIFGTGPLATTIKERAPEALGATGTVLGTTAALRAPFRVVKVGPEASTVNNPQSISAAAATPSLAGASPELQQAAQEAVKAQSLGQGKVNTEALTRHAEADSLPVPVPLTKGMATQDPATISIEQNTRSKVPGMPERLQAVDKALKENVTAIRDRIGPDVFSTDAPGHGDTLISAYKAKDAPVVADIRAKYKALEDANGGQFPLDTKAFVTGTDAALSKALKTDSLPADIASSLRQFRNGRQMTFEDFESMRSDAADAARTATNGRERAAANIVRQQLEDLPMPKGSENLKPLADAARAAAKKRFDALEEDPAYAAAISGSVSPDKFVSKFITGTGETATRDSVGIMKRNLAGNDQATQTMGVAALDHLKDQAIKSGNFTQAGFNNALKGLTPKLKSLVDPKTAEDLDTLGRVSGYAQFQPKGSWVNNSNTNVASVASHAGQMAAKGLAAAGDAKTGVGGTLALKFFQERAARAAAAAAAREHLAPGAGILEPLPAR